MVWEELKLKELCMLVIQDRRVNLINEIRSKLNDYIGEEVVIKYNLGRNKYEKYSVIIKELYDNVFLVELNTNEKKSFSYSDVITNTIKIDY